jgi:spermidine/putrescine transport system substrate-binding protein
VGYDVTIPEADYAQQLAQANYLLELDQSKLPNFKNISAPFQNPWYDPGAKHSIPYSIWTTGIFWNKKALGPMTGSWNDLWKSAAKAKGKIWLLDDMKEVIGMSLLRNHQPISSTDKSQVDRATAEVLKLKPAVRGFTTLTDPMTSGQGVMQHFWSGTSYQVLSQVKHPEQWSFETAKEGVPVGSDAVVIPKNAPHKNTAQLFLNWLLAPENASINPLATGYPMMTAASLATYGKMVKQYPFLKITIPEVQHGEHFTPLSGSALAMYSANWAKIKA